MFHCNPPSGVHNSPGEGEDLLHNSDSKITPFYNSRGENHRRPGRDDCEQGMKRRMQPPIFRCHQSPIA